MLYTAGIKALEFLFIFSKRILLLTNSQTNKYLERLANNRYSVSKRTSIQECKKNVGFYILVH
jgi:hypothetical protein